MNNFQKQALFVVDPAEDNDFDPNKPPENGEEYLQRVIYERKFCPPIVVVEVPDLIKDRIELSEFNEKSLSTTHHNLIPTSEWQAMQAKRFSLLREKMSRARITQPSESQLERIPDIDHQAAWHEFCAANPPLCSTITMIKEQNLRIVIEHLLVALSENSTNNSNFDLLTTDSWLAQWIYATLSLLHTPLEPYTHSILRDIAKICIQLRNTLREDETAAALPLNLLICIISNNFNQLDLCD